LETIVIRTLSALAFLTLAAPLLAEEPWTTYRGNPQRTGHTDGAPGPTTTPKVLWVHKGNEHFIASPVPVGKELVVAGLGGFNVPTLFAFNMDPAAKERVGWSRSAPPLKLPSVSSPALYDGKLIFGDGMHQTDGAILHCLKANKGGIVWQYTLPGNLVHMEGSPTVADGKVYLGGGAAGVICIDPKTLALDGKEMTADEIKKRLDAEWAKLEAKYEKDKKENPMFAFPPRDDQLPIPSPKLVWQAGKENWHVDAPVAVVGDKVLVASAFLDKEKVGDRALFGLDAKTGEKKWRTPLTLNPWGGPSVLGDVAVVTGSNIGYDIKSLKGAKGSIAAFDIATGKEKWNKPVQGGVVSCAALADGAAVVTATDGKVRAFDLATGDRRWIYDAKTPLFAPPAIAGDLVYVGDLNGVVHAVGLKDGNSRWTLDVGKDPAVDAPGMVYAGPVVHGGRLYVATCNVDGPNNTKPRVVVCLGAP
jgi:outer membrane protein assembly factor BamB